VVRPNCDTFYSSAFLDLSDEPLVLDVPKTDEQYYLLPMLDAFTNVIQDSLGHPGSPGKRTGQVLGGQYLLVGPTAGIPDGADTSGYKIINCPTDMVWIIGRFQVNDADLSDEAIDGGGHVQNLQNQLKINKFGSADSPAYGIASTHYPQVPVKRTPNEIVAEMPISEFFNRLNFLLINNPPAPADAPAMDLFATIGVGPGKVFDILKFDPDTREAMRQIPGECIKSVSSGSPTLTSNYWTINLSHEMGNYGTDYNLRAIIAYNGLGANLVEDAVYYGTYYDSGKQQLNGANNYTLTLNPPPPTHAFWSLTMYNPAGLFIENPINRYAVGHDTECPLVPESDGSIVIYIQNEEIDANDSRYPNWLPAPTDDFNVMIRIYWPDSSVIDETNPSWLPPAIEKV
jgi:hypothetical protein